MPEATAPALCGGVGREHFAGIKATMVESSLSLLWFTMMPCFPVVLHLVHYQRLCLLHVLSLSESQAVALFSCLPVSLSQSSLSSGAHLTWQAWSSVAALLRSRPRETFLKHVGISLFTQAILLAGDTLFCHFPRGIFMHPISHRFFRPF